MLKLKFKGKLVSRITEIINCKDLHKTFKTAVKKINIILKVQIPCH